jgi:hypothetical protein
MEEKVKNMSRIKFFYLRDEWERYMSVPLIHIKGSGSIHTHRVVRGNPIACVAYEKHVDPDVPNSFYVIVSLSIANPKDKFSKSLAREIAAGRLDNANVVQNGFTVDNTATSSDILKEIMICVTQDGSLPNRIRRSAAEWLNITVAE